MAPATMRSYEDGDAKSATSHRSTQSSRSSVLERARAYNRRIEDQNRRAKSAERMSEGGEQQQHDPVSPRSQSAGRQGNRVSTRERAMASVRHDTSRDESSYLSQQNSSRNGESFQSSNPRSPGSQRSPNVSQSTSTPRKQSHQRPDAATPRSSASKQKSQQQRSKSRGEEPQEAVVSPELLVDALSGHEDGLLAIAEKLMEHYDQGYDVMGEAIIDAFADVQKLFQHVVEAAHMEGAAFEASRREVEVAELRKKATAAGNGDIPASPTNNGRHDEFIDQDVKDILTEAINNGAALRDAGKHMECYELYESSCQNASSLLPVDSDHRGRLQLSIARAESMSPDRACAILRYAMDDVLRSGLRADKGLPPNLEVSKRSDMVLSKPKDLPSISGEIAGVVQSSEEALASLVEELKEVLGAPVYDNTPLQSVARRFWAALADAQRSQQKNEERLEQNLAKLKGEFLMARAVRISESVVLVVLCRLQTIQHVLTLNVMLL